MDSAHRSGWQPILDGSRAVKAWQVVEEIAIASLSPKSVDEDDGVFASGNNPSLSSGTSGVALFFAYLGEARHQTRDLEIAGELAEQAVEQVAHRPASISLYSGFPGVAWVSEHLSGRVFEESPDDVNREVDALLLELLAREPWPAGYDLLSGLVGLGVYALERLPHESGRQCLEKVLEHLAKSTDPRMGGVSWHTPANLLASPQRELYPAGCHDLGMAHGIPGVIAFLGRVCASIESGSARQLLEGAVEWLDQQKMEHDADSRFPYVRSPDHEPMATRLAWCYGDPGISASLLVAGSGADNRDWLRLAIELALDAAHRNPDNTGVVDGSLCHGSAGLAHIFNRFFQATREEAFRTAALYWFDRTFELQQPGLGVAGFRSWEGGPEGAGRWRSSRGFLTGTAGIGLALLAALQPQVPEWDRILLLS